MFEVGDKIKCIDPTGKLGLNKIYTIRKIDEDELIIVYGLDFNENGFFPHRFIKIKPIEINGLVIVITSKLFKVDNIICKTENVHNLKNSNVVKCIGYLNNKILEVTKIILVD